jgi:hypothetical protein
VQPEQLRVGRPVRGAAAALGGRAQPTGFGCVCATVQGHGSLPARR